MACIMAAGAPQPPVFYGVLKEEILPYNNITLDSENLEGS